MAYKLTEEEANEIRTKDTKKKFTKDQMEALTAMVTFICTFKMSVGLVNLASLQLKLLNFEESSQEDLELVKLWIDTFGGVMIALLNEDFQKDFVMLVEDFAAQFPEHIKARGYPAGEPPEDVKIH